MLNHITYFHCPVLLSPLRSNSCEDRWSNVTTLLMTKKTRPINTVINSHYATLTLYIILTLSTSLSSFLRGSPGVRVAHTLHRGRSKETEIDGGRQSLLAFLKGQLHWVIDIQPDLILISLKKIVQEEREETREEVKKIKWRDVKTGKKHVWRLRRIWWRITAHVSGAVTVCVYFGVKQGTRRHEYRLERHSIASHINKGRRSVRSHAVHPSDRTRTHSQKRLQHKQPFWAQTGGKIGHLLIGNVINSPVTNSAIIFISSRLLWVVRRQEAEFDFLLRAPQLQLCVLSHQVFQMLALKALVWVFWYCHQDVNLQRLHMSLQPASLYSPWWLSN